MPILDSVRGQQPTMGSWGAPATVDGTPAMDTPLFRRCTGHCCQCFCLGGMSLEDFRENLRRSRLPGGYLSQGWPQRCSNGKFLQGPVVDIELIVDMLIPWKESDPRPVSRSSGTPDSLPRFTCRYLDGDRCSIYSRRPHFCRSYPNGACEYRDCTREH